MLSYSAVVVRRVEVQPLVALSCCALLAATGLLACSSAEPAGSGGQGGGGSDGKFHPKANAVAVDEMTACDLLHTALETKQTQLGCILTLRTCPSLVQVSSGKPCFQYDQGTIKGCSDYYAQATDCPDLTTRSGACVFQTITGSAPQGCPAQ